MSGGTKSCAFPDSTPTLQYNLPMTELTRCNWAPWPSELMLAYHDEEWGVPHHDDRALFELLTLEGAQAGLSWNTILNKRENYRRAFDNFDIEKVARYTDADAARLLADPGIVRNRLKVASTITNAQAVLARPRRVRLLRRLHLALRRRRAEEERLPLDPGPPRQDGGIRRHEQGPRQARLPLRRQHHLLRLHASHRPGQ